MIKKIMITLLMIAAFSVWADAQSQRTHSRTKTSRSINYKHYYNKDKCRQRLVHRLYQKQAQKYFFKYTMPKSWYDMKRRSRSTARYYKRR